MGLRRDDDVAEAIRVIQYLLERKRLGLGGIYTREWFESNMRFYRYNLLMALLPDSKPDPWFFKKDPPPDYALTVATSGRG